MANVQTHGETKIIMSRSVSKQMYQVVILFREMCRYLAFEKFPLHIEMRKKEENIKYCCLNIYILVYCVNYKPEESETGRWDEWTAPQEFIAQLSPAGLFCPSVQRSHRCGTGGQGQK